ncbi:MAG: putative Mechanosensitive ion channel family protein, partial [Deltaproteobacteria bacterium]|nr:putative Mechanosensitive ion channel family protein [Deltaproteobacteria bacterium]
MSMKGSGPPRGETTPAGAPIAPPERPSTGRAMLRLARPATLAVLALLAATYFLILPASPARARIPLLQSGAGADGKATPGAVEAVPATGEEIDRKLEQIRAQLDELRLRQAAERERAAVSGMTPGEASEWRRMNLQLIFTLEAREQALRDLKMLRYEIQTEPGRAAWDGFSGNPPYPLAALVNLHAHIYALRGEIATLEVRRAIQETGLNTLLKAREASEQQLRQAEEALARSAGKKDAAHLRVRRDLAMLRNRVNSEGALTEDVSRILTAEKGQAKRKQLVSLEEQYHAAEIASPLTREDLERVLADIDARRAEREKLLAAAIEERKSAKTALEASRTGPSKSNGRTERLLLETAISKTEIYQGSLKILFLEEALWQERYRLARDEDAVVLRKKRAEAEKAVKEIGSLKESFGNTALMYLPLIQAENEKLRSATLPDGEKAVLRTLVAAYQERQALWTQVVQGLTRLERDAARWKEDLDYRIENATATARTREAGKSVFSTIGKLWNTELYVAEGTTVIEGQKIVRPFSVTAGKVAIALVILLAGLWGTRRLGELLKRFAARRVNMDPSRVSQMERKWTFFSFLFLLAFSLAFVNIPLAVFAFFGGILAIGIGFGAQHLIGNLISSIIMMFDRTISVGDIVEMEGQFGKVKSIGLRSSIIQRFDGVEVLVPNSQFLEQKVTNWTLSDQKVRFE